MTKLHIAIAAAGAMLSSAGQAAIMATSGQVAVATPATLVYTSASNYTSDTLVDGPDAVVFGEVSSYEIPTFSSLNPMFAGLDYMPLDISSVGTNVLSPLNLPSGTGIDSYIVQFSPVGHSGSASGSITFDREIIGIELSFGLLREDYFGSPAFNLKEASGLEIGGDPASADFVTISADRKTLGFSLNVDGATDVFRVFTQPTSDVPEPAMFGMLGLGALALMGRRRLAVLDSTLPVACL